MQIKAPVRREPLNAERAFIVQIELPDPLQPGSVIGRIEHIESGDRRQFNSVEQLATIIDGYRARR